MNRNEFALECMNVLNDEMLKYEPGSPIAKTSDFDSNGNRLFRDCEGEKLTALDMLSWYHILCHDEDFIGDDMITPKMKELLAKGYTLKHFNEHTPKIW